MGIISGKYNMKADVLHSVVIDPVTNQPVPGGSTQDESGDITTTWDTVPDTDVNNIPELDEIWCKARASQGNRGVDSTEDWDEQFIEVDWVQLKTNFPIRKTDRVTNIRDRHGRQLWTDENGDPVLFDVVGIVPAVEPYGHLTEYDALLRRV